MKRVLASELADSIGKRVKIMGWLHNLRRLGRVNFVILRDRTGLVQAVAAPEQLEVLEGLQVESVLEITGVVVEAPAVSLGVELQDIELQVLSRVNEILPFELNKAQISASLPVFLDHAVVGHRHPRQQAVLRLASGIVTGFRRTLEGKGLYRDLLAQNSGGCHRKRGERVPD